MSKKIVTYCPFSQKPCMLEQCHLFAAYGEDCVFYGILSALRALLEKRD